VPASGAALSFVALSELFLVMGESETLASIQSTGWGIFFFCLTQKKGTDNLTWVLTSVYGPLVSTLKDRRDDQVNCSIHTWSV
jgi:hypothetical protein